jgi:hypothetical protein
VIGSESSAAIDGFAGSCLFGKVGGVVVTDGFVQFGNVSFWGKFS